MLRLRESISQIFFSWVEELPSRIKRIVWLASDLVLQIIALLTNLLIFGGVVRVSLQYSVLHILFSFFIYYLISKSMRVESRIKRYSTITDLAILFLIVLFSNLLSAFILTFIHHWFSLRFIFVLGGIAGLLIVGLRLLWQMVYLNKLRQGKKVFSERENMVLIGAGDGGSLFMSSYHRQPSKERVVAILDEDPAKKGLNIGGVEVVGDLTHLKTLVDQCEVKKAVIAIPSLKPEKYEEILEICNELGIHVYNMPPVEDVLLGTHHPKGAMRKINISDLLGRKEIQLDESVLRQELEGKTILITGAGGSIGSEIVRQVSKHNPAKIVLLGHGENSIYLIYHEMTKKSNQSMTQYYPVIADVQDYDRLIEVFSQHQPDIVYHAAAHKHVPLMEANPVEAFKNNIIGTYHVAKAVDTMKIPKMVMISTDKAVNPPNVMGATKRVAELIITGMSERSESVYCAVRFGNVLGSRGSVVPAFQKQIAAGGPVQVTDFRMIRYFMTIPEASRLVVYAGTYAKDGEVFILDMGQPVKILDLAKKMILLSGHTIEEIGIKEIGIRPGEKLYEELLTESEMVANQLNDKIFVGKVTTIPLEETLTFVENLKDSMLEPREFKQKIIDFANASAK